MKQLPNKVGLYRTTHMELETVGELADAAAQSQSAAQPAAQLKALREVAAEVLRRAGIDPAALHLPRRMNAERAHALASNIELRRAAEAEAEAAKHPPEVQQERMPLHFTDGVDFTKHPAEVQQAIELHGRLLALERSLQAGNTPAFGEGLKLGRAFERMCTNRAFRKPVESRRKSSRNLHPQKVTDAAILVELKNQPELSVPQHAKRLNISPRRLRERKATLRKQGELG